MIEPPELVTLLPEEEEPKPEISEDLKLAGLLALEVTVLVALKVGMVYTSHRVMKTVRRMNKINFPRQRNNQ